MITARSIPSMLILALCTGLTTGCHNDVPVQPETSPGATYHMNGVFAQLPSYFARLPSYAEDRITYDVPAQLYRFRAEVNGTICNIGYQSNVPSSAFAFKISRVSDSTARYKDVLQFSATTTQYANIPEVKIQASQD